MERKGNDALRAILVALALGVGGAALFKGTGYGINILIWTIAVIGAVFLAAWRGGHTVSRTTLVGLLLALFSAVGIGWYSSPDLRVADWIAFSTAIGLAALGTQPVRVASANAWDLSGKLAGEAAIVLGHGLATLGHVPWKRLSEGTAAQKNTAVLRGALIAAPLILLFGALFSQADAVFSKTVADAFSFNLEESFQWVKLSVLFAVLALAVVGGLAIPIIRKPPVARAIEVNRARIGLTEVSVVLGSLCVLFGVFVAIQFQYLFGGSSAVVSTTGLSYSDYARKGFFELVWVAGLCLPLLIGAQAAATQDSKREIATFRSLATLLTCLLFVVMASAMTRMQLYVESYGLTPLRVSVTAFMIWLTLVFCWFLASLHRGAMQKFAFGALAAGFGVVAALNFLTPDRIAARYNVARFGSSTRLDAVNLASLGAESVPFVLANWERLSPKAQEVVRSEYEKRFSESYDWRGATASEMLAERALR